MNRSLCGSLASIVAAMMASLLLVAFGAGCSAHGAPVGTPKVAQSVDATAEIAGAWAPVNPFELQRVDFEPSGSVVATYVPSLLKGMGPAGPPVPYVVRGIWSVVGTDTLRIRLPDAPLIETDDYRFTRMSPQRLHLVLLAGVNRITGLAQVETDLKRPH